MLSLTLLLAPTSALRFPSIPGSSRLSRLFASPSHSNVFARFKINDLEKAKPFMDTCVKGTRDKEPGCIYYGWTLSEDNSLLFCRETYESGKAVTAHFENAGGPVGAMIESGAVDLEEIGVMCPKSELADAKVGGDAFGCVYYTVWDDFNNWAKSSDEESSTKGFLTIQPTFSLLDQKKAEPFMKDMVTETKKEAGCIYYGWTISEDGKKLFCREAYTDGEAVNTHLAAAGPLVGAMLDSGAASLDKIELHGPADQIAVAKETCDAFGFTYWPNYDTFSKFTKN